MSALMAMAFVACDNYDEPNPPAQSNPATTVIQNDQVSVTSDIEGTTVDIADLNEANLPVTVATLRLPELNEKTVVKVEMQMAKDDSFQNPAILEPTMVAATAARSEQTVDAVLWNLQVTPSQIQTAFYNHISKGPKNKIVKIRYSVTVDDARIGGFDHWYGPYDASITPLPSDLVIADNYYLLGTVNDWSVANALELYHPAGVNPYDDPKFWRFFNTSADWWWKVVPVETYNNGNWMDATGSSFGPKDNGESSLKGMLFGSVLDADGTYHDSQAGCIKEAGLKLFSINMEDQAYEFKSVGTFGIIGGATPGGWDNSTDLTPSDDKLIWEGEVTLTDGEFKFRADNAWDVNLGGSMDMLVPDGGNMTSPGAGTYYVILDLSSVPVYCVLEKL